MTANNENQTNSQPAPDNSGTPLPGGSAPDQDVDPSSQKDEWIDDLGTDEFDELEDGPAAEMGKLPSPRAWDESVESAATGIPPQRKTSSTFDDLPTYEQIPDSSDAKKILGEDSGTGPVRADAPPESAGFPQAGSGSTGSLQDPSLNDPSLIKPGFDEQEQSIHLDAAQLARLAYAIEETPTANSGIGVRHEGAMDAAQLAQLAFAIEDDPGRSERSNDADSDHLASLAKAIQVTRGDVNQPAEPMEPTNHQMKYTFDDLAPVDKNLLKGTSAPSQFTPPTGEGAGETTLKLDREEEGVGKTLKLNREDGDEETLKLNREEEDTEKTLKLSRGEGGVEETLKLSREEENVEETLKTSPRTNNPLTNSSLNLPPGVIDNEIASAQQTEDGGEATLRLQRNESGPVSDDLTPQSAESQPPNQVESPSQNQQPTSQTPQTSQLPPVLGQLIKRPTIDAESSLDADSLGSESLYLDSLQPGGFDTPLTDVSSGAAQAASQARTGIGRILNQRSGASQSQSQVQMPSQQPLPQGAIPPLPAPGVIPQVPPNISQSQLPAQPLSGPQSDVMSPLVVQGQVSPSYPPAFGTPPLIPDRTHSGALPLQPGALSAAAPLASQQPGTQPGAAPPAQAPGTQPGAAPPEQAPGTQPGAAPPAQAPGAPPDAAPSAPPPGAPPDAAPSAHPAETPTVVAPSVQPPGIQMSGQPSSPPPSQQLSAPPSVPPLGPLPTVSQPAPSPEDQTTLPSPPAAPGATPFASQNPRTSATSIPPGPAPFGIPAPEHRAPPFARADASAAAETVVTGDVLPVVSQQPGLPKLPVPRQSQGEPFSRPELGAPQQTSQVGSGLTPANGDSTFEIPLLDREVAATTNATQDPSVVFFGKREAVMVRHAPSLSYKPSAKRATSQSYVELLTAKPQLDKRDVDDTTGENILVNNTPLVKISHGLSGAHPAQIPQAVPANVVPEPEPVVPGFNAPNMQILLGQAPREQLRIEPVEPTGDSTPPVPATPIDPPLQLERPPRRDRPSNSRAGMPARGPVLLRGSAPDIQEGSQEQSIMPSEQGAVMPANRTPLILGGIVVVCMVVGLFAGSIFMSKKKEDAPPVGASSLTKPEQPDSGAAEELSTYKRAFAAEQQKDYAKALKLYSAGLTESPDDPEMWSGRGRVLTHEGQFVRAESDIRKALELSPGNKKVLLDLAALFYYKKDYEEAVKQYNAIIKKQPNSSDALFGRGLTLVWLNKRKEAVKDFQKVIVLNPKHVLAYKQLAVEYMEAGDARQALKVIDAGLLNAAQSEELFFERALASYKLGKKEDAVEDYTKAIKLNSNRKDFFNDRGFVRLELRQYSGAIEDFKRALEIDPGYTIAQDNLARARKEQNE